MSHFAQIENNIVTNIIAADQEFIDTLEGTWIQTSYNTRGGIHYNTNIWPPSADGGVPLRKNHAGVGFTYDVVADAFIPPNPNTLIAPLSTLPNDNTVAQNTIAPLVYTLNRDTFLWEPPKPSGNYSWKFNQFSGKWEPPIPMPDDGGEYTWFETLSSWVKYTRPSTVNDVKLMTAQELSGLYISVESLKTLNVPHTVIETISAHYLTIPSLSSLAF